MKRILAVMLFLLLFLGSRGVSLAQPAIEGALILQTPVTKFITDATLKAFAEYAKKRWGVDVKVSALHAGTPTSYGKIIEWAGRPQADIFWGGESALYDKLAEQNLLVPLTIAKPIWDEIPVSIGRPVPLPLKDPKRFWVGTTLEPYGIIFHPRLLARLGVPPIKDWDDLLNPKLKGHIAQCTPDRSSSNHASYEVILQLLGWEKGWEWARRLAANTGNFTARSRDVPSLVSKGEFAVGFAVPSYMAFEERVAGFDVRFVYPSNAYVTCEPIGVLRGAPNPRTAQAFIEFLLTEEGQRLLMERGLFSIYPRLRVSGPPGSQAELAVEFTGGVRSFYDNPVSNVYVEDLAQKRYSEVNDFFRKEILEKHRELIRR
jgi:iron(III) transport system substrate-binding protein